MITASHNPPEYNGYKAYWGNGAQIIPPTDVGIAKAIEKAPPAKDGRAPYARTTQRRRASCACSTRSRATTYLAEVKKLGVRTRRRSRAIDRLHADARRRRRARASRLRRRRLPERHLGAGAAEARRRVSPPSSSRTRRRRARWTSRSRSRARKKADLVVANDPDADRLAIALPSAGSPTGYVQLTGNQVGALLGHYLLTGGLGMRSSTAPRSSATAAAASRSSSRRSSRRRCSASWPPSSARTTKRSSPASSGSRTARWT